jgi:hypothetical protein
MRIGPDGSPPPASGVVVPRGQVIVILDGTARDGSQVRLRFRLRA